MKMSFRLQNTKVSGMHDKLLDVRSLPHALSGVPLDVIDGVAHGGSLFTILGVFKLLEEVLVEIRAGLALVDGLLDFVLVGLALARAGLVGLRFVGLRLVGFHLVGLRLVGLLVASLQLADTFNGNILLVVRDLVDDVLDRRLVRLEVIIGADTFIKNANTAWRKCQHRWEKGEREMGNANVDDLPRSELYRKRVSAWDSSIIGLTSIHTDMLAYVDRRDKKRGRSCLGDDDISEVLS